MIVKKFFFLFKTFFKAKWVFLLPRKVDIVVFDGILNPFSKFLQDKKYSIFYNRNEEINIILLLQCFLNFKISKQEYIKRYFKYSRPILVITAIDNSINFLKLKDFLKIKTASIQLGTRTYWGDLIRLDKILKHRKKKFKVDLMFVFNNKVGKIYNKYIDGKKIEIGSYINNEKKIKKIKKKEEVLFLSTHKPQVNKGEKINGISMYNFFKGDKIIIQEVSKLCSQKKLNLNILGRIKSRNGSEREYIYFKKILKDNFNFISGYRGQDVHEIIDKYKYIITIDSTLGQENLSRGGRSIFISNRPWIFPSNTRSYGFMEKLPRDGEYWCNHFSKKKIKKTFNTLFIKDKKFWNSCVKKHRKKVMLYDKENTKFTREINKYLKF